MGHDLDKAREVFIDAVGRVPADRWEAFVAERCGADEALLAHVRRLLRAHAEAGSFLGRPAVDAERTSDPAPRIDRGAMEVPWGDDRPGARVGPYKLLQPIGEGGMGSVWMAEQQEPVQRKVALKLIKAGMDSKAVLARFEAERQALALMDHPNIARVLDGGTTAEGRPYFVMELVKGVP